MFLLHDRQATLLEKMTHLFTLVKVTVKVRKRTHNFYQIHSPVLLSHTNGHIPHTCTQTSDHTYTHTDWLFVVRSHTCINFSYTRTHTLTHTHTHTQAAVGRQCKCMTSCGWGVSSTQPFPPRPSTQSTSCSAAKYQKRVSSYTKIVKMI